MSPQKNLRPKVEVDVGRSTKLGLSTMNKHKRRSYKKYRGQGKR